MSLGMGGAMGGAMGAMGMGMGAGLGNLGGLNLGLGASPSAAALASAMNAAEERYAALFMLGQQEQLARGDLFFSYSYDLTRPLQQQEPGLLHRAPAAGGGAGAARDALEAGLPESGLSERGPRTRFVWNHFISRELRRRAPFDGPAAAPAAPPAAPPAVAEQWTVALLNGASRRRASSCHLPRTPPPPRTQRLTLSLAHLLCACAQAISAR